MAGRERVCAAFLRRGLRLAAVALTAALCGAPFSAPLAAQGTQVVLSSGALVFPAPRLSNYEIIPIGASTPVSDSVSVDFTVVRIADLYWRNATVKLRCVLVTGSKPCTDVQWRSQGSATWQDISTLNTTIDSRWIIPLFFNDPWSGRVWLRMKLSWTTDVPASYGATIAVTLDVYRP
jgi:hypothetical protein